MSAAHFDANTTADEVAQAFSDNIKGKVILITGVSPGSLGSEVVHVLAKHQPRLIIIAGRNTQKLKETEDAVLKKPPSAALRSLVLDLSSLDQVRTAAAEVNAYPEHIDILINNAGIMAAPYSQTVDGFESQFGINHLAPFLFTNLIMPKLLSASDGARVVVFSSDAHAFQPVNFKDPNWSDGATYDKWKAYGQAKSANVLFAKSLAEKLRTRGLLAYSLHPGVIETNLGAHLSDEEFGDLMTLKEEILANAKKTGRVSTNVHTDLDSKEEGFKYKTLPKGAATHLVAALNPHIASQTGEYLQDCQVDPRAREPFAVDPASAERLWTLSEQLVGQTFLY
ncbi:hypothetical protein BDV97DRAFT_334056 [Delphinella strobiligena]|nr:hypothetical protein BDV97DRAFT_334056 [Delphinella strobiligena]